MKVEPKKGWKSGIHNVEKDKNSSDTDQDLVLHMLLEAGVRGGIWVTPLIKRVPTRMELFTGDAVSQISASTYHLILSQVPLKETSTVLKAYSKEKLVPKGTLQMKVEHDGQSVILPLYVVEGKYPPFFGKSWLESLKVN